MRSFRLPLLPGPWTLLLRMPLCRGSTARTMMRICLGVCTYQLPPPTTPHRICRRLALLAEGADGLSRLFIAVPPPAPPPLLLSPFFPLSLLMASDAGITLLNPGRGANCFVMSLNGCRLPSDRRCSDRCCGSTAAAHTPSETAAVSAC